MAWILGQERGDALQRQCGGSCNQKQTSFHRALHKRAAADTMVSVMVAVPGRTHASLSQTDITEGWSSMQVGDTIEDFTLQNENDETVHLSDYSGKPVVLFFYPRADTPGCTIEACGFRDTFKKLEKAGVVVLGISRDTPKAQKKFKEKYDLPYTLLADVDERVCNQFGVMKEKNMYGKKVMGIERTTFLIGPDRKLLHVFEKVKPEGHAEEVLSAVKPATVKGQK
jgi:peroxiredoxin Q/BCP